MSNPWSLWLLVNFCRVQACGMTGNKVENMEDVEKEKDSVEEWPPELQIKHPLQTTWTLWYYENDRNKNWEENQREVTDFDTAEDFWSLYNHIKMASKLRQGCDYSLFKKGIRPMWEDDANKRGGRWLINLTKNQRGNDLDNYWLQILLCMIGEAFDEHSEDVCGAVVNVRAKGDKIGIWTADAMKTQSVMEIGRKLKQCLSIGQNVTIGYQIHKDTMVKAGSVTKNTYIV